MWSAIAGVLGSLFSSVIGGWFDKKRQQEAMAKAYHEKSHKEIQTHMAKAFEKPSEYYDGNPKRIADWVRSREESV